MRRVPLPALVCLIALALVPPACAENVPPIQDNSFLVEEAYNQEKGVVQHIYLSFEHPFRKIISGEN